MFNLLIFFEIAGVDSAQWWILPPGVPDFS